MDEIRDLVVVTLRGMWRWRWTGLGVAWIVGIVGAIFVWRVSDRYEALARVYVDTQSVLKPLMQGLTVEPNVDQQITMLSRTLISRPNVAKLIDMAGLDRGSRPEEVIVDDLIARLKVAGAGRDNRDNLYTLTFRDTDPRRAKRVIESLSRIFVESSRGQSQKDSSEAKAFIDEQIKSYEARLEEAESKLKEFRLRYVGLPDAGTDLTASINEATSRLSEARLQLREAENARDSLKRQLTGESAALLSPGGAVPEIDSRIDAVKRNLDSLMQRYTEQHPDVVGAKRVLAQLEEQRRRDLAAMDGIPSGRPITVDNVNPVYQELRVSLARAEANVATMQTRVAEFESRFRQLKESARVVPEVQAELARLNRDYEVNKRNYEALVARRESAKIAGDMDTAEGIAEFRVVEPPRVSSAPVFPSRRHLIPLTLVVSFGAGALACFLRNKFAPVFVTGRQLREFTGLPVLGSVTYHYVGGGLRARAEILGLVFGAALLVASYGMALFLVVQASRPLS